MKNQKLYAVLVSLIPAVQAALDTFNMANMNGSVRMYTGAVLMLLLIVLQGIQIYLNPALNNRLLWVNVVALIGYISGGIIDHLQWISLSDDNESLLRLLFSFAVIVSNAVVKVYEERHAPETTKMPEVKG